MGATCNDAVRSFLNSSPRFMIMSDVDQFCISYPRLMQILDTIIRETNADVSIWCTENSMLYIEDDLELVAMV